MEIILLIQVKQTQILGWKIASNEQRATSNEQLKSKIEDFLAESFGELLKAKELYLETALRVDENAKKEEIMERCDKEMQDGINAGFNNMSKFFAAQNKEWASDSFR